MKFLDRFKTVLENPTWEQVVEREPLLAFSHYLSGRTNVLFTFADEIVENLDQGFSEMPIDGGKIARAESLMWLWMLGAYEVVRTICQAKTCFSAQSLQEFSELKRCLSVVRMPAAKMEKPGKKIPVTSSRSPAGWDVSRRDLLVSDPESTEVRARDLINHFERVFSSLKPTDILASHESAYAGDA